MAGSAFPLPWPQLCLHEEPSSAGLCSQWRLRGKASKEKQPCPTWKPYSLPHATDTLFLGPLGGQGTCWERVQPLGLLGGPFQVRHF